MDITIEKENATFDANPNIRRKLDVALALALVNVLVMDEDISVKQYLCAEKRAREMVDST
ncbi:MAG: hypothetical protein K6B68_05520 [Eubacterium sp.]|nr:hypothetical protein [Eubacterium sp.]